MAATWLAEHNQPGRCIWASDMSHRKASAPRARWRYNRGSSCAGYCPSLHYASRLAVQRAQAHHRTPPRLPRQPTRTPRLRPTPRPSPRIRARRPMSPRPPASFGLASLTPAAQSTGLTLAWSAASPPAARSARHSTPVRWRLKSTPRSNPAPPAKLSCLVRALTASRIAESS